METAMKRAATKKVPKGMSLKEYRLAVIAKDPIIIKENGRNVWNIKPYKD